MKRVRTLLMVTACSGLLVGCASEASTDDSATVAEASTAGVGLALAGIDADEFAEVSAAFAAEEEITDGLGPVFNETGCGVCHFQGALGGSGTQVERRYGRFVNGRFDDLANRGGSLRQLMTLGDFTAADGSSCSVPLEREPEEATVHNVGRASLQLFGIGLIDALPDGVFDFIASQEPVATRGVVNRTTVLLGDPADPAQNVGNTRVARFGWKAGVPTVQQFSADAYVNEMGITTQSCFRGVSVKAFATESAPNGVAQRAGCDDLAPAQPADPDVPQGTDDAVGSCANNRTEIQDDIREFFTFMTFLAPPPRGPQNAQTARGEQVFDAIGCDNCHLNETFRTPANPANGVPGNFAFQPFSDFLAHDMGALGDLIGNDGDAVAVTRRMRTQPLWGIRFKSNFLHDQRAATIGQAVGAHSGQGAAARDAFNRLNANDRAAVSAFVLSL